MATSSSISALEELNEDMSCILCTDMLQKPHLLNCRHTFCLKCLLQLATIGNIRPGSQMNCPACRESTKVPPGGVAALEPNSFLTGILYFARNIKGKQELPCEVCIDKDENLSMCKDCGLWMCSGCQKRHPEMLDSVDHRVVTHDALQKSSLATLNKDFVPVCQVHTIAKQLFCAEPTCTEPICIECKEIDHQGHATVLIQKKPKRKPKKPKLTHEQLHEAMASTCIDWLQMHIGRPLSAKTEGESTCTCRPEDGATADLNNMAENDPEVKVGVGRKHNEDQDLLGEIGQISGKQRRALQKKMAALKRQGKSTDEFRDAIKQMISRDSQKGPDAKTTKGST